MGSRPPSTVSLCMIVRDEEELLPECLESVKGVVGEIFIVDTGSIDRTADVAASFGAKVQRVQWRSDFAWARNLSLDMPSGAWVLMMDADERLAPAGREILLEKRLDPRNAAYEVLIENLSGSRETGQHFDFKSLRLFQNRPDIRFEGIVHETITASIERIGLPVASSDIRLIHLGYLDEHMKNRRKIERNLEPLLRWEKEDPFNPVCQYYLGQSLRLQGRLEEAEWKYRACIRLVRPFPSKPLPAVRAFVDLADLLREQGRNREALPFAVEGTAFFPNVPDIHFARGRILIDLGAFPEAMREFETCLASSSAATLAGIDPGVTGYKALNGMGICFAQIGDLGRARDCFTRALREGPARNPDAELNLGLLDLKEQKWPSAVERFSRVTELDPGRIDGWIHLGFAYFHSGRPEDSLTVWRKALSLRPSDPNLPVWIRMAEQEINRSF